MEKKEGTNDKIRSNNLGPHLQQNNLLQDNKNYETWLQLKKSL
jgi:hypothetical protein